MSTPKEDLLEKLARFGVHEDWFDDPEALLDRIQAGSDAALTVAEFKQFQTMVDKKIAAVLWFLMQSVKDF